jgi:hypothetical protein
MLVLAAAIMAAASAQAQTFQHYECDDGGSFELALYPETKAAFLQIDGKSVTLPKRFSLRSQRFSKGGVSLSVKGGGGATVKRGGRTSRCRPK